MKAEASKLKSQLESMQSVEPKLVPAALAAQSSHSAQQREPVRSMEVLSAERASLLKINDECQKLAMQKKASAQVVTRMQTVTSRLQVIQSELQTLESVVGANPPTSYWTYVHSIEGEIDRLQPRLEHRGAHRAPSRAQRGTA